MTEKSDVSAGKRKTSRTRRRATVRHSAARLAAVQALYQIDFSDSPVNTVIEEFRLHRLGAADAEVSGGAKANDVLFQELVRGAISRQDEIDTHISNALDPAWPLERIAIVMQCILRVGTFELISRFDVPARVVVKEFVDLAHSFFSGGEPGMVNGVLDKLAHQLRPGELETSLEQQENSSE
ncbi:MAG: transcription antitermination factor NusB [Rhodospirillaceae bacterium]|nr:transcription antitermination factor NusB [Rhodospirillaceae bacterium]|tara:strand:+ start:7187 stop:7732 length:546 start_codon:yes stop_codon:yes gene_type:complete